MILSHVTSEIPHYTLFNERLKKKRKINLGIIIIETL